MKQPVVLFYVYGILMDTPYLPQGYTDSFRRISIEMADLLIKDPHQTEVKICAISSLMGGELLIEVQALDTYHEETMKRKDVRAIFIKHLHWMHKEKDITFAIRNGLQLIEAK
jgi:hypothetical protein